jgi:hypothetical protein
MYIKNKHTATASGNARGKWEYEIVKKFTRFPILIFFFFFLFARAALVFLILVVKQCIGKTYTKLSLGVTEMPTWSAVA